MGEEEFEELLRELARQHKGFRNAVVPQGRESVDETIDGVTTGRKLANPNPTYRYVFGDNTYIEARATEGGGEYVYYGGTADVEDPKPKAPILRETDKGLGRYNEETGELEMVPGGEKAAKDPTRPPEPNVSTSAAKIPVWNETTKAWEWQDNPNYREPAGPVGRETPGEVYAKKAAEYEAQKEFLLWKQQQGLEITPAEQERLRQAGDLALQAAQDEAAMARQTQAQDYDRPFKEADDRRADETLGIQRAQTQAGVLQKQAEQGQNFLTSAVKSGLRGVENYKLLTRLAFDPAREAADIVRRLSQPQQQAAPQQPAQPYPMPQGAQAMGLPMPQQPPYPMPR